MESLKKMISLYGTIPSDGVVKVDSFLNHMIDPNLILEIGKELASRFNAEKIDKILTIEASGIAPALGVAFTLGVPVLFAKKSLPSTMVAGYQSEVHSFTKKKNYTIFVSKEYISKDEKILIVDDFLAMGNSLSAMNDIIHQADAQCIGAGIVIEKSFQQGRQILEAQGMKIESLVRIKNLSVKEGFIFYD